MAWSATTAPTKELRAVRALTSGERLELQNAAQGANDAPLIAAVQELLLVQDQLQGTISYDAETRKLRFNGPMTLLRRTRLQNVSPTNPKYQDAINALFAMPRGFMSREMRTFSTHDFATELAALPPGLQFSKALRGKVYFDDHAEPHTLHFVGVMTAPERATLIEFSNDPSYQAAVNVLFTQPEALVPEASDAFLTAPGPGTDASAMFDVPTPPEDRFRRVLATLLPHLRQRLSERLVAERLAEALNLQAPIAAGLLTRWVASPVDPTSDPALKRRAIAEFLEPRFADSDQNLSVVAHAFPAQFKTYVLLHKIAAVVTRWKVTSAAWAGSSSTVPKWLAASQLPTDRARDPQRRSINGCGWPTSSRCETGCRGASHCSPDLALAREPGIDPDTLWGALQT